MSEILWGLFHTTLIFDAMLNIVVIMSLLKFKWNEMKSAVFLVGLPVGIVIYCIKILGFPQDAILFTTFFGTIAGLYLVVKSRTWHFWASIFLGVVINIVIDVISSIFIIVVVGTSVELLRTNSLDIVLMSIPLFILKILLIYLINKFKLTIYRKAR